MIFRYFRVIGMRRNDTARRESAYTIFRGKHSEYFAPLRPTTVTYHPERRFVRI